ncbi:MAG TPA: cyclic nucleotide-binding domain-containing protein [Actinomycetota bacterium]|nr:cyclic nucleotide-binding domain-containing protein [Actinomycetota bacterium]
MSTGDVYSLLADDIAADDGGEGRGDVWERIAHLVDPTELRPKLADDIEIRKFDQRWGEGYVMIANPRDLLHFRLAASDLALLELMDGTRTVKEIVVERFEGSGEIELSTVIDLVRSLYRGNFLEQRHVDVPEMVSRAMDPITERRRKARQFGRTLSIEWEGAHRLVQWLYDHGLRWVFKPAVLLVLAAAAIVGLGAFVDILRQDQFVIAGRSLAIGFIVLIVLDYVMVFCHELGHAVVIVHNGRRIRSAGFQIYFGSPAFFVESSDGLMMPRRQQILESFAGPFAQLVLAGIASLIARTYPEWVLSETMYKFAVLNYLVVIMNLIPLLELDGYYILADLIEVPDLRERSLVFMRRDLFHKLRTRERFSRRDVGLALYGVLGIAFTVFSLYTAYYYWQTVFGDLVSRLWAEGTATRLLLLVLAAFIAGPLLRGLIKLLRAVGRELRAVWRRIRFRLETGWRVEASELIDALPMFEDIPVEALNEIAGRVRLRGLGDGQPVFRQGEQPDAFYVVRRGVLEVVEEDTDSGGERRIRDLGRGESFGELGLVTAAPRAATIRAVGPAEVFEFDKGVFDHLLADKLHLPDFEPTLQQVVELRGLQCFTALSTAQLWELLERGSWVAFAPGEEVMREGDVGDAFYAISSGQVDIVRDERLVTTIGRGSYFGEVALLMEVPRTATVIARTPVRAFRLDREGFDRLVGDAFRRGTLISHAVTEELTH